MFSDVDPLDSSVSPFTSAAIGPSVGQYYRGAAVVALSLYGGVSLLAVCGALLLFLMGDGRTRTHSIFSRAASHHGIAPYFALLRFPSAGVLLVGVFGQGLAACGVSLIRLGDSGGDVALGIVSLLVCIVLAALAGLVTTCWLQVRIVKQKLTRRHGWAGIFLSAALWPNHWKDTSGELQFKRRYMLLIDDLHRPWWTAVEMSSSAVQGSILGLRINSLSVCRGQLWALVAHSLLVLVAAAYFRPCGAVLSNVFLLLSKLGALLISSLLLFHSLTLNDGFAQAAQVATSVSTAIATAQVIVQLITAVLLLPFTSHPRQSFARLVSRVFRAKGASRGRNRASHCDEVKSTILVLPLSRSAEPAVEDDYRVSVIAGQAAGAVSRQEVLELLIRAVDLSAPRDERLYRLLQAAIAQRLPRRRWFSPQAAKQQQTILQRETLSER